MNMFRSRYNVIRMRMNLSVRTDLHYKREVKAYFSFLTDIYSEGHSLHRNLFQSFISTDPHANVSDATSVEDVNDVCSDECNRCLT